MVDCRISESRDVNMKDPDSKRQHELLSIIHDNTTLDETPGCNYSMRVAAWRNACSNCIRRNKLARTADIGVQLAFSCGDCNSLL